MPDDFPSPPSRLAGASPSRSPRPGSLLARIGGLMQLAPLIGLFGTVVGMLRSFEALASGSQDASSSSELSAAVSEMLMYTAIGLLVAGIGWILLLIAIFAYSYRARWIFWLIIWQGIVTMLQFPAGTVVGAGMIVLALVFRNQFWNQSDSAVA